MVDTSLKMYEDILDSLMGGVIYINSSMRIEAFNQVAERICGRSRKKALQSPLKAAQLLSKKASEPGLSLYTDIIIRETDRLDGMLMEVAALTRPRSEIKKDINIHRLLDSVVFLITEERSDVNVLREYDPSLPLVCGDESVLTQVFLNLVKNAREALPDGGTIALSTRIITDFHLSGATGRGPGMAAVEIRDNGCGIAADDLERIFTPFFTTKPGGSGLGMPLSLKIVKEQGGYLKIESREGEGTRVKVFLPIASARRDPLEEN